MAPKQEQQEASTEVTEVAPGVLRMQLPISMPGLGHVNMYALIDDQGAAVVDPGLPGDDNWSAVKTRLRSAGLKPSDVHTVLVTHSHPDHFGGAARFREETQARVIAHKDFEAFGRSLRPAAPEVSVDDLAAHEAQLERGPRPINTQPGAEPPWFRDPDAPQPRTPWGGQRPMPPREQRHRWHALQAQGRHLLVPRITHVVDAGDVVRLARRNWTVLHTPGHTNDHFCLHDPESGTFLAGDHVLPTITPHISGLSPARDPLQRFFDSLDQVAALDAVQLCLPAHGNPFSSLSERTEAIKRHHRERLLKLKSISKSLGPATVQAFSENLFAPRSWGGMAESETYAHLEHLRLLGQAECHTGEDGQFIYVTDAP